MAQQLFHKYVHVYNIQPYLSRMVQLRFLVASENVKAQQVRIEMGWGPSPL